MASSLHVLHLKDSYQQKLLDHLIPTATSNGQFKKESYSRLSLCSGEGETSREEKKKIPKDDI